MHCSCPTNSAIGVEKKKKEKQMQGRFHPNQHLISFVAKGWGAHITINNSNNLKWLFYLLLSLPYIYCYFYLFMQFGNVQMLLSMCFVAIHWFWLGLFRLDWSLTTRPNCPTPTWFWLELKVHSVGGGFLFSRIDIGRSSGEFASPKLEQPELDWNYIQI